MTTKEFLVIEKRLLPWFPSFAAKGALMFIQPIDETLRGFHWEPSGFSKKEFYVNVFFLPLYIPTKQLHFTFGHRVGSTKRWSADQSDLETALSLEMQKEISFLMALETARDVAKALEPLTKPIQNGYVNPHCAEAFAYALLRAGETTGAMGAIDRLLKKVNPAVAWENQIASRARLIRDKLLRNPQEAQEQLAAWQAETIHDLGLETLSHRTG